MPTTYGVNDPVPNTYISHLLYPFKRQKRDKLAEASARSEGAMDL
jgi:hypothetical protein